MILDVLYESSLKRVARQKEKISLEEMKERAFKSTSNKKDSFYQALKTSELAYICEIKKASPSKGVIAKEFPYLTIAKEYERAGAAAISVLTEPEYFLGNNKYLKEIAKISSLPILRKDFIVDPYQIYEARALGASAILLISSILSEEELLSFLLLSRKLGLDALVEAHTKEEITLAIKVGADIIGVNNRNLKDFSVDLKQTLKLRQLVPAEILFVAESGISTRKDVAVLEENKVNAVLIGESLMRSSDKKKMLATLKGLK